VQYRYRAKLHRWAFRPYLALAIGKVPGLNVDRAGVALVGAGLWCAVA
jgi:hypothetical protein